MPSTASTTLVPQRNQGAIPLRESAAHIPLVPLEHLPPSLLRTSHAFERLRTVFSHVALREPPNADAARWHHHRLAGRELRLAQPLTFTPYASARACSARCLFCSENLRDDAAAGPPAATLRPDTAYFRHLRSVLSALHGVPLSYSLSGLESTDDPDWLIALLQALRLQGPGPQVQGAVLYTNGAGLATDADRLLPALRDFGLSWIEWSRHHDDGPANQHIMRFREGQAVAAQDVFEAAVAQTAASGLTVKLVCVVQRGGVERVADVWRYVDWARSLGASSVIFREFSELPARYRANATRRHVDTARVSMDELLLACLDDPDLRRRCEPVALTGGYYFWNARWKMRGMGPEVVFERSDYGTLLARESADVIYKLVFHANGHLCSGWDSGRNVLWRPDEHRDQCRESEVR